MGLSVLLSLLKFWPTRAQIEITNRCNLGCNMCPRRKLGVEEKDMDFELFKDIVSNLDGIKDIILTGWGEPLLHPQISYMIRHCKSACKSVRLTTNGIFENEQLMEDLLLLDSISFSIDRFKDFDNFGHNNIKAFDNLRKLIYFRRKNGYKKPYIIIQSIYYDNNEKDIFDIVNWAKGEGVNLIKVVPLDMKYIKQRQMSGYCERMAKFYSALEKLAKQLHARVDVATYTAYRRICSLAYGLDTKALRLVGLHCYKPLGYLYVTVNGYVTPCCSLPGYILGDLNEEKIQTICGAERMRHFWKKQVEICKGCSFNMG